MKKDVYASSWFLLFLCLDTTVSTLTGLSVEGLNQNETYAAWSCLKTSPKSLYPHKRQIKPGFPPLVATIPLSNTLLILLLLLLCFYNRRYMAYSPFPKLSSVTVSPALTQQMGKHSSSLRRRPESQRERLFTFVWRSSLGKCTAFISLILEVCQALHCHTLLNLSGPRQDAIEMRCPHTC